MYTATVTITGITFPNASAPYQEISPTLSAPQDTTPGGPTGVFSGTGESITITFSKANPRNIVQLTYQLSDPTHTLLGIAFAQTGGQSASDEFPFVNAVYSTGFSQVVVTDTSLKRNDGNSFEYIILVQKLATGQIGYIDPAIETEIEQ